MANNNALQRVFACATGRGRISLRNTPCGRYRASIEYSGQD